MSLYNRKCAAIPSGTLTPLLTLSVLALQMGGDYNYAAFDSMLLAQVLPWLIGLAWGASLSRRMLVRIMSRLQRRLMDGARERNTGLLVRL